MIDITHKSNSLRVAVATARLKVSNKETIRMIKDKEIPKGDVLEMAKTAGLFGVKQTAFLIPDCHPLPVEYTSVEYTIDEMHVDIFMTVKTIYKTGVEVEAMHGVSVVALTMYDMLKPVDKGIEIENIRLVSKKGGKSDFNKMLGKKLTASVIVCSDSINAGIKEDKAGLAIKSKLEAFGVDVPDYCVVPDEKDQIESVIKEGLDKKASLIILTGGTGLSVRDVTTEVVESIVERRIPGIEEQIRNYGQQRTPYAMLSRSVVGETSGSLIMALPGSTRGASESIDSVFPAILHVFGIMKGAQH